MARTIFSTCVLSMSSESAYSYGERMKSPHGRTLPRVSVTSRPRDAMVTEQARDPLRAAICAASVGPGVFQEMLHLGPTPGMLPQHRLTQEWRSNTYNHSIDRTTSPLRAVCHCTWFFGPSSPPQRAHAPPLRRGMGGKRRLQSGRGGRGGAGDPLPDPLPLGRIIADGLG